MDNNDDHYIHTYIYVQGKGRERGVSGYRTPPCSYGRNKGGHGRRYSTCYSGAKNIIGSIIVIVQRYRAKSIQARNIAVTVWVRVCLQVALRQRVTL